jgi:DHA1 family bicyclomycin/chloramphenicol resistance-like MFS transporter
MFSVVFAVNSAGLVAMSQIGGRIVGRVGAPALLRAGVFEIALGSIGVVVATVTDAGLAPLLISLFVIVSCNGIVFPNATATALAEQEGALGSASALLGVGQFGTGALVAPLVGVAGSADALPMAIVIGACGLSALAVNLIFGPGAGAPAVESEMA